MLSAFTAGVFFALIGCSVDAELAGKYPIWVYAMFISSQLAVAAFWPSRGRA